MLSIKRQIITLLPEPAAPNRNHGRPSKTEGQKSQEHEASIGNGTNNNTSRPMQTNPTPGKERISLHFLAWCSSRRKGWDRMKFPVISLFTWYEKAKDGINVRKRMSNVHHCAKKGQIQICQQDATDPTKHPENLAVTKQLFSTEVGLATSTFRQPQTLQNGSVRVAQPAE